jgi:hypothetical protein
MYGISHQQRQTLLIDTIGKNNFFMNAFDSSGEAQAGLLSVRSNDEYREFITGIAKKLSLQSYETGDIICHKYEEGTEMYLIHEGEHSRLGRPGGCLHRDELERRGPAARQTGEHLSDRARERQRGVRRALPAQTPGVPVAPFSPDGPKRSCRTSGPTSETSRS